MLCPRLVVFKGCSFLRQRLAECNNWPALTLRRLTEPWDTFHCSRKGFYLSLNQNRICVCVIVHFWDAWKTEKYTLKNTVVCRFYCCLDVFLSWFLLDNRGTKTQNHLCYSKPEECNTFDLIQGSYSPWMYLKPLKTLQNKNLGLDWKMFCMSLGINSSLISFLDIKSTRTGPECVFPLICWTNSVIRTIQFPDGNWRVAGHPTPTVL